MKTSLTLALCAMLSFSLGAAPASGSGPQLQGGLLGPLGTSAGDWDLPTGPDDGFAAGLLVIGGGFPMFAFSATLPAESVITLPNGKQSGIITGTLLSFPLPPDGQAFAQVGGSWTVDPATGDGFFHVAFFTGGGPFPPPFLGPPKILVGGMRGRFHDLDQPVGPDALGSYHAIWTLL